MCVEGNISTGKSSFLKLLREVDDSMEVRFCPCRPESSAVHGSQYRF